MGKPTPLGSGKTTGGEFLDWSDMMATTGLDGWTSGEPKRQEGQVDPIDFRGHNGLLDALRHKAATQQSARWQATLLDSAFQTGDGKRITALPRNQHGRSHERSLDPEDDSVRSALLAEVDGASHLDRRGASR